MAKKLPTHLKLHKEEVESPRSESQVAAGGFDLGNLLNAFARATGWLPKPTMQTPHGGVQGLSGDTVIIPLRKRMQLVSTSPIDGMLDVEDFANFSLVSEETAWNLLEQIDALVQQLSAADRLVARQEAQLATSIGVTIRADEADVLAARLSESLERAVELTGSDAAALYLLDDQTSELKMRCCYGMSATSLNKPARSLRGALADLEALMGNAVLLENTSLAPEWNCPEPFAAAMCLPIGSPTMPHGTIWLWSDHVRDFGPSDIDAAKASCDKILVDIERSVLAEEVLRNRSLDRQVQSASIVQASRLPDSQPMHADYETAGWTFQGQALGGNFHTWTVNKHRQLCAALGAAASHGAAGALVATSLQTVLETCWNSDHRPHQVLRKANDILWGAQDGDWRSSIAYAQIDPNSGRMQYSVAGNVQAFLIGQRGFRMLSGTATLLAAQPDTVFQSQEMTLEAGELLLFASADVVSGIARGGFSQDALLQTCKSMLDEPVDAIVDHLARMLPMTSADLPNDFDRSLLVIRRRF